MNIRFWFFIKRSLDDEIKIDPIYSDCFLGDIGDFIEIDGVGFIIIDYVEEVY